MTVKVVPGKKLSCDPTLRVTHLDYFKNTVGYNIILLPVQPEIRLKHVITSRRLTTVKENDVVYKNLSDN